MAVADDPGTLAKWGGIIFGGAVAFATTVFGFLFHRVIEKHDEEITAIKSGIKETNLKLDAKLDRETYETNRQEQRSNVIELHRKIEKIGSDGEQRHRELVNLLMERRSRERAGD